MYDLMSVYVCMYVCMYVLCLSYLHNDVHLQFVRMQRGTLLRDGIQLTRHTFLCLFVSWKYVKHFGATSVIKK
jgi:hypothetical protein